MNRFRQRLLRHRAAILASLAILVASGTRPWGLSGAELTATDELAAHAKYLAAPERGGRGVGTPGIAAARDYIAAEFAKYGLIPGGDDNSYLQSFDVAIGVRVKTPSSLALGKGPALTLNEDWRPLRLSLSGRVEGEAVFAGYGITAKDHDYDDYAGIDVKGKVVIVLRYEPPPKNDQSPFRKSPNFSIHAALRTKAKNARDHGAVGMILIDMDDRLEDKPELISLRRSLRRSENGLVAAQIKRQAAEKWFAARGISLKNLKDKIDRAGKPASVELHGTKFSLQVTLEEDRERTQNVIGILPGRERQGPPEYIVIGAHYDHLGRGAYGARASSDIGVVHHGADDNASGTSVLLYVARRFSQIEAKPERSIVFVGFSAEELGLHGSRYFIGTWPDISTISSMINLDMVGRLRDNRVTIFGARSAPPLEAIVGSRASQLDLQTNLPDGFGPSDHLSFYNKQIPALHFFTGRHADYHRPGDTWDKLNYQGMARIGDLVLNSALAIAALPQSPNFVSLPSRPPKSDRSERRGAGVYLGIIPESGKTFDGALLAGATAGSPAAAAGSHEGDVIVQFTDKKISNIDALTSTLDTYRSTPQVTISVQGRNRTSALETNLGGQP